MFLKHKLRLIMLLGNATMMLMDSQDRSAQLNLYRLCIRIGIKQMSLRKRLLKQAKESSMI